MRNVLTFGVIFALAAAASSCRGGASSPTSPSGVVAPASFTLSRIVIGLANEGIEETGRPVTGPVVPGTKLMYNLYFIGPATNGATFTYRTYRNNLLVDTSSFTGGVSSAGVENRTSITYTPMASGNYRVEAALSVAPDAITSATYEVR